MQEIEILDVYGYLPKGITGKLAEKKLHGHEYGHVYNKSSV